MNQRIDKLSNKDIINVQSVAKVINSGNSSMLLFKARVRNLIEAFESGYSSSFNLLKAIIELIIFRKSLPGLIFFMVCARAPSKEIANDISCSRKFLIHFSFKNIPFVQNVTCMFLAIASLIKYSKRVDIIGSPKLSK